MSSPTTTATTAAATATLGHHRTCWCHECDMSILLPSNATPTPTTPPPLPRCPHCHTHFLEHMDSFTPLDSHSSTTIWGPPSTTFPPLTADTAASVTAFASDDNFLLNSPYLQRLIQHLTATNNGEGIFYDPTPTSRNDLRSPASKRAVESLKIITIDYLFLENDPTIICPICKDQFGENSEAKELPCNHMYHSDCITLWLEVNNTCPLCRFRLATEEDEVGVGLERGETYVGALRLDDLVDDDVDDGADMLGFRRALMRMWNGNEVMNESGNFLFSPTQIGEAGNGVVERASIETVPSWPTWTYQGDRGENGLLNQADRVRT